MKYARVLLEHCPEDTTQLFIDYYTGQYRPRTDVAVPSAPTSQGGASTAVFQSLASFLLVPLTSLPSFPYTNRPSEVPQGPEGVKNDTPEAEATPESDANDSAPAPQYTTPSPRTAFSSFVDKPDEFIIFLEACMKTESLSERDKIDLYTTLFEMYLSLAKTKQGVEKERFEAKAKELIDNEKVAPSHCR